MPTWKISDILSDINKKMHCHWFLHSTSQSFFGKQDNTEDTETVSESPDVKSNVKSRRIEDIYGKTRYSDIRESEERTTSRSFEGRRRKRSKRIEKRKLREQPRTTDRDHDGTNTGSSIKHYSGEDNFIDKSRKRKKIVSRGKCIILYFASKNYRLIKKIDPSLSRIYEF